MKKTYRYRLTHKNTVDLERQTYCGLSLYTVLAIVPVLGWFVLLVVWAHTMILNVPWRRVSCVNNNVHKLDKALNLKAEELKSLLKLRKKAKKELDDLISKLENQPGYTSETFEEEIHIESWLLKDWHKEDTIIPEVKREYLEIFSEDYLSKFTVSSKHINNLRKRFGADKVNQVSPSTIYVDKQFESVVGKNMATDTIVCAIDKERLNRQQQNNNKKNRGNNNNQNNNNN